MPLSTPSGRLFLAATALFLALAGCSDAVQPQEITCWGGLDQPTEPAPAGLKVKQFDVFGSVGCAIDADDTLVCWGKPNGDDDWTYDRLSRYPKGIKAKFLTLSASGGCVIDLDGKPVCWGGLEDLVQDTRADTKYTYLNDGAEALCLVSEAGTVSCVGRRAAFATWLGELAGKKITSFQSNFYMACWTEAGKAGFSCRSWGPDDKPEHRYSVAKDIKRYKVQSLGNRLFYVTDANVLHILEDGKERGAWAGMLDFDQDWDTCELHTNGELACAPIGGGIPHPYGPAMNVPKGPFTDIKIRPPMACALRKS